MEENCACSCLDAGSTCMPLSASSAKDGAVNLILVPSGFNNHATWRARVQEYFQFMSGYPPLDAARIDILNVWYVDAFVAGDVGQYCWFGCFNTPRLLCCQNQLLLDHSRQHCGSGFAQSLLVIHNSAQYGGAGGRGFSTTSVHPASRQVAVHEIGHSLFGFADEYTNGWGRPSDLNCEAYGCADWADLIGRWGVYCMPNSCEHGHHYTSENTFMRYLESAWGEVNERFACCKYLWYDTSTVPEFCRKFDRDGLDLMGYCSSRVWRASLVQPSLLEEGSPPRIQQMQALAQDPMGAKMDFVENPQEWHLDQTEEGWVCSKSDIQVRSGLYLKAELEGEEDDDDGTHRSIVQHNKEDEIEVEILDAEGSVVRTLSFHPTEVLEVPPDSDGLWEDGDVAVDRPHVSVIIREGEQCRVKA